ncbi:MAG: PGPGW domain-containing protein [Ancrocorticia sp.]
MVRRTAHSAREAIRRSPNANLVYRTSVGIVGGATTVLGVVLMPLPGPGTVIAIGGLAILATEFESGAKARDASIKGLKMATEKTKEFLEDRRAKKAQKAGN